VSEGDVIPGIVGQKFPKPSDIEAKLKAKNKDPDWTAITFQES
jgi:hypothetical protein